MACVWAVVAGWPALTAAEEVALPRAVDARRDPASSHYSKWSGRIGLGLMSSGSSEFQAVLDREEYGDPLRWGGALAADHFFLDNFGVGAWGGLWRRTSHARYGGPAFSETNWHLGLELPARLGWRGHFEVLFVPRVGLAWATPGFGGAVEPSRATSLGGEVVLSALSRRPRVPVAVGLTFGWMRAVAPTRGAIRIDYDAGGFYFLFTGGIHD